MSSEGNIPPTSGPAVAFAGEPPSQDEQNIVSEPNTAQDVATSPDQNATADPDAVPPQDIIPMIANAAQNTTVAEQDLQQGDASTPNLRSIDELRQRLADIDLQGRATTATETLKRLCFELTEVKRELKLALDREAAEQRKQALLGDSKLAKTGAWK